LLEVDSGLAFEEEGLCKCIYIALDRGLREREVQQGVRSEEDEAELIYARRMLERGPQKQNGILGGKGLGWEAKLREGNKAEPERRLQQEEELWRGEEIWREEARRSWREAIEEGMPSLADFKPYQFEDYLRAMDEWAERIKRNTSGGEGAPQVGREMR
jgi:hypothetical protein